MENTLLISNALLWVAVIILIVAVMALSRQIGILYERVAPMGALMMDSGPAVGEVPEVFNLQTINGTQVAIGGVNSTATLIFFLSPNCPVCKKLIPILKSLQLAESEILQVVLASDGDKGQHLEFYKKFDLHQFPYVLSEEMGLMYRISKLPYAVLIDQNGVIKAKGLVNSREQLDSLITAHEMNAASIQSFQEMNFLKGSK